MQELKDKYSERQATFAAQAAALRKRYNYFSVVRLVTFFAAVGLGIYLYAEFWQVGIVFTILFLIGFYRFMLWHGAIKTKEIHQTNLAELNGAERKALDYEFGQFEGGKDFVEAEHPYSYDLDIYGEHSFFQFVNRTSTAIGRQRLAQYLEQPANTETIQQRQQAVQELSEQLDWRQHFQAYGLQTSDELHHTQLLKQWLHDPAFVSNSAFYRFALYFVPIWMIACIFTFLYVEPWQLSLLFLALPIWIIRKTVEKVNKTHLRTTHAEKALSFYAKLIGHVETQAFESSALRQIKTAFETEDKTASQHIGRLSYIISQLNMRYNALAIIFNIMFLWDLQWINQLEKWRAAQRDHLPKWFEALAELEALISLATLRYNQTDWTFPEVGDYPHFDASGLGHPLISPQKRVSNDVHIPTSGHIKLITGSNMAGKSTFLRTVGLNIVLALCGAPVCARRLELPVLQVYTSMRTQDALHENTSSFFAELKRLKFIIEAVEQGANIFFLLDEILKGTNSRDRHTGSKALIKQLIEHKGAGIIATHDLELGDLEAQYGGAIENLRIEVEIEDGQLHFDYKLKKGVSESFNATILMQQMGIRIDMNHD
ncbi:MAG: hypothetical protein MRY78_13790 [Saprospiraceae bacterium]|nr:hypothetical protein [Saprospiraceae bacterium]